jgi:hypothetical protein
MNLLSQLLPGVRDLRTPLAVGVLWSIFLVMLAPQLPAGVKNAFLASSLQPAASLTFIPQAVQTSLIGLAVYLIGVISSYVSQGVTRIIVMLFNWRSWLVVVALAVTVIFPVAVFGVGAGVGLLAMLAVMFSYSRSPAERFSDFFDPIAIQIEKIRHEAAALVSRTVDSITSGWSSERRERAHFLKQDATRRVLASPFMRNRLVKDVKDRQLIRALTVLDVRFDNAELVDRLEPPCSTAESRQEQKLKLAVVGAGHPDASHEVRSHTAYLDGQDHDLRTRIDEKQIVTWGALLSEKRPYKGPTAESVFQHKLQTAIEDDPEMAHRFVWHFTRIDLSDSVLDQRIAEARVRLKADQPAVYDEYDRIRSEGDFRTAIAIPLAACVVLFGYMVAGQAPGLVGGPLRAVFEGISSWSMLSEHPGLRSFVDKAGNVPWLSWIVGVLLLVACIAAGRVKDAEAARLLYASIRQKIMEVDCADLFQDSDVRVRGSAKPNWIWKLFGGESGTSRSPDDLES